MITSRRVVASSLAPPPRIRFRFPPPLHRGWNWTIFTPISRPCSAGATKKTGNGWSGGRVTWPHRISPCVRNSQDKRIWVPFLIKQRNGQPSEKECPRRPSSRAGPPEARPTQNRPLNNSAHIAAKKHFPPFWGITANRQTGSSWTRKRAPCVRRISRSLRGWGRESSGVSSSLRKFTRGWL